MELWALCLLGKSLRSFYNEETGLALLGRATLFHSQCTASSRVKRSSHSRAAPAAPVTEIPALTLVRRASPLLALSFHIIHRIMGYCREQESCSALGGHISEP